MPSIPPLRSLLSVRGALIVLVVVAALVVGRFVWDDVIAGDDIPRGVSVAGVAIGNTDRDAAATRLAALEADREVTLRWQGEDRVDTLAAWGVVLDVDATLDRAENTRGGGPLRFLRWLAAVVRDRPVEPVWTVDRDTLASRFGPGGDAFAGVALDDATVTLVDGEFVAADGPTQATVDVDALEAALLDAANDPDTTLIEVPAGGTRTAEGDPALAEAANELTADGLEVILAGRLEEPIEVPVTTLREWVVFADPPGTGLSLDPEAIDAWFAERYPDLAEADGVTITAGFDGRAYVLGALPGAVCCAADTADRLLAALEGEADQPVVVFPDEPADAEGLAWAYELGIEEVVGEFTTYYRAGQDRTINIARIAELTRGAVIEPGETFSVNDYVGVRTTDKGFVPAGVISNGVFSSSVGGGISQYATTLFNAAFFAGLDFGEYQSHSIYIDRYPYGREATVSYPHPDLQIRNTTPYGVMLWPTTTADSITVRLYSTPWVRGEQTGQSSRPEGAACTRVTTERTRTWLEDGRTEVDTVTARYRPEGIGCDGRSTVPTTTPPTTSVPTTVP